MAAPMGRSDWRADNGDIDIVEKFLKITGPAGQRQSRGRGKGRAGKDDGAGHVGRQEKVRENIRKKLALEASVRENNSGRADVGSSENNDLEICFMNDIASDDELLDPCSEMSLAAEEIARCNISQKVSQIIVPIYPSPSREEQVIETSSPDLQQDPRLITFQVNVKRLQNEAMVGLKRAQEQASIEISDEINTRKRNSELFSLLGITECKKLNRRILSGLNVAQLQVIQNNFLAQIETLNDNLVKQLISRDERIMEQDAMLTDIEDVSEFINHKK